MFVRTQFDTIVNLAEFDKIKIEWSIRQNTGNVFHVISAVSEERIISESIDEHDKHVSRSETLALFREDMKRQAEVTYSDLFNALLSGETAFDMTDYPEN